MEIEDLKPCPFCGSKLGGGAVARQHPVKKFRAKAKEQAMLVTDEERQAFRDFFEGVKLPYQEPEWFLGVLWF